MSLGIYISVPFCRSKCSFCNFASGVFSRDRMQGYVDLVCAHIKRGPELAAKLQAKADLDADSIYLGGGTPSTLAPQQLRQLFDSVRTHFAVSPQAEITVECAPGTISAGVVAALVSSGVNRVSLGAQSFVDKESSSVGRLHTRKQTLDDIALLRSEGIANLNVDLIAGLPYQTPESWQESLEILLATGVPHASVYMLEVDDDSRLGSELIAGGARYHAHHVPDDSLTADLYERAVEFLNHNGISQYEISNFAVAGLESRHNLKYWKRLPYLGFGLDAHSMLPYAGPGNGECVRFSTADDLDVFQAAEPPAAHSVVTAGEALEERMFLGLRLNQGVELDASLREAFADEVGSLVDDGLLAAEADRVWLTPRGRLFSNEVFQRFVRSTADDEAAVHAT